VPVFSGFSGAAIGTRLQDSGAVCVVTADAYSRRGRHVLAKANVDQAVAVSPSVRHVVVHHHAGSDVAWKEGRDVWWRELVEGRSTALPCVEADAEQPV